MNGKNTSVPHPYPGAPTFSLNPIQYNNHGDMNDMNGKNTSVPHTTSGPRTLSLNPIQYNNHGDMNDMNEKNTSVPHTTPGPPTLSLNPIQYNSHGDYSFIFINIFKLISSIERVMYVCCKFQAFFYIILICKVLFQCIRTIILTRGKVLKVSIFLITISTKIY